MAFSLTKKQLLFELYIAESNARKNKTSKKCVIGFEKDLHNNLLSLCEELYNRKYKPEPSYCFIIEEPKKREVFAANYRDRIVHHFYFNMVHELFERTFIYDTYSCIKERGTHFGINRLYGHIKEESKNYTKDCYVLKMDVKGYFMHINRNLLLVIANDSLEKQRHKRISKNSILTYDDILDFDFIKYLTKELILIDPTIGCVFNSEKEKWDDLPKSKTLFNDNKECGLPIGNLTSQLFSNVYMNVFDQYCKRELKCRHYGRYVDDFYIVDSDKAKLKSLIPMIEKFLLNELKLEINDRKTKIIYYKQGVEFLGCFVKPYRKYISNGCLKRIKNKLLMSNNNDFNDGKDIQCSINSYLGIFKHDVSYNIRKSLFSKIIILNKIGFFNNSYRKFYKII